MNTTPHLIQMPKTASKATSHHLGQTHSHEPAWKVARWSTPPEYLFGILRSPSAWYESWYLHAARWSVHNARADEVLRIYGNGSTDFDSVLVGLTNPDSINAEALERLSGDPLWHPGTIREMRGCSGGLWSRSVRWHFGEWTDPDFEDGRRWWTGRWSVQELVPITELQGLGVSVLNEAPSVAVAQGGKVAGEVACSPSQAAEVLASDLDMWVECCSLVKGVDSPARIALRGGRVVEVAL